MESDLDFILKLEQLIQSRKETRPDGSYTTQLFDGGTERIGAKVREEALELIEAASPPSDPAHVVHEAADLAYHVLVLLVECEISTGRVVQELKGRFGVSGLEEKASRD